jgi:NAD(P)-dependent dehydrogenase (short-subunit alcohol dehydrogenase family)
MTTASLADRVVLLTGGSAGIGRATLRRLSAAGAAVVVCARDGGRLAEAVAGLPRVTPVAADTGVAADRERLVQRVLEVHGRLDAVVHDAALGWAGLVEDMPAEAVEQDIAVNLTGVVDLTRRALPHLLTAARERGRADVVVVASVAGWSQVPPLTVYSATKAGVTGFVKGLRREVTSRGVRVHGVHPGPVSTEWLVRGRGAAPGSDADALGRQSPGIAPERVAEELAGCWT